MKIILDNNIRIPNLSDKWVDSLSKRVSVKNEEKSRAQREHVWGADNMPDEICLANVINSELFLPRGFFAELLNIIRGCADCEVEDHRIYYHDDSIRSNRVPEFTEDQKKAIKAILFKQQGRIIAPTGSGKTFIGLGVANKLAARTLILVDKINIADQWVEKGKEYFGFDIGTIGDNKWDEKLFTVATIQTLWSRREELDDRKWWDRWSVVMLDEQHHVPSKTYYAIISRCPAQYRIGLSATIGKSETKKRISELVFGPILYESTEQPLQPEINIVDTDFEFPFKGTQKIGKRVVRNNYQEMIKELVGNADRNRLIAEIIVKNKDHTNLIISRRLSHLDLLRDLCVELGMKEETCLMLTGKENAERRKQIYDMADCGSCVIFSTIAFEALDIPRIDRIYLAYPIRNQESLKQVIGRGTRKHKDKDSCIIYDLKDINVGVLRDQFRSRLQHYQKNRMRIEKIAPIPIT